MNKIKLVLGALLMSTVVYSTDHALIIGCCGEYKSLKGKDLYGTTKDAYAMKDIFKRDCKEKNIKVLLNSDATKGKIKKELKRLKNSLGRGDKL